MMTSECLNFTPLNLTLHYYGNNITGVDRLTVAQCYQAPPYWWQNLPLTCSSVNLCAIFSTFQSSKSDKKNKF